MSSKEINIPFGKLSAHSLFNRISEIHPILLIDTRDRIEYEKCHLKGSINCICDSVITVVDAIKKALENRKKLLNSYIVFCGSDDGSYTHLNESIREVLLRFSEYVESDPIFGRIMSIYTLDNGFHYFYNKYHQCSTLFELNDALLRDKENRENGSPSNNSEHQDAQLYIERKLYTTMHYPSEIIPDFLYLGDQSKGRNRKVLDHLSITHIVDATGTQYTQEICQELDLKYMPINVWDDVGSDLSVHFESVNSFISSARASGGRVLVHCRAGVSRSTTLVLAYLMHSKTCPTLRHSLEYVMEQRPFVCPNHGFCSQLRQYEASYATDNASTDDESLSLTFTPSYSCNEEMTETMQKYCGWFVKTTAQSADDFLVVQSKAYVHMYNDVDYLASIGAFPDETPIVESVAIYNKNQDCDNVVSATSVTTTRNITKKPFLKKGAGISKAANPQNTTVKATTANNKSHNDGLNKPWSRNNKTKSNTNTVLTRVEEKDMC